MYFSSEPQIPCLKAGRLVMLMRIMSPCPLSLLLRQRSCGPSRSQERPSLQLFNLDLNILKTVTVTPGPNGHWILCYVSA